MLPLENILPRSSPVIESVSVFTPGGAQGKECDLRRAWSFHCSPPYPNLLPHTSVVFPVRAAYSRQQLLDATKGRHNPEASSESSVVCRCLRSLRPTATGHKCRFEFKLIQNSIFSYTSQTSSAQDCLCGWAEQRQGPPCHRSFCPTVLVYRVPISE